MKQVEAQKALMNEISVLLCRLGRGFHMTVDNAVKVIRDAQIEDSAGMPPSQSMPGLIEKYRTKF